MINLGVMARAAHNVLVKNAHVDPVEMPGSGAKWDWGAHEDFLIHGDDPRLPAVARKAIMQEHINKSIAAPLHTPEEALREAKGHGKFTGGTLGTLGGLTIGGIIGVLTKHPVTGLAVGGIGGGVLGAHIGAKRMGTPENAAKNVAQAKKFQEAMSLLNADEVGKERMLSNILARRYESLHDLPYSHFDDDDDDDWDYKKKANAVTSLEGAIARRGASAISRAVPTAAEGALGHATAAAASRGIPRSVSEITGAAGSGVRAIPKGPPPVPAQAKGLFAAPAVSPFAGTAPGVAPAHLSARYTGAPTVAPMPPTSTQHVNFLSKQPGLGFAPQQAASTLTQSRDRLNNLYGMKLSELIEKFAGTGHQYYGGATQSAKPKKSKSRRAEPQLSGSFGQLVERLCGSGAS